MKKMKRLLVAMLSCLTAFACVAGMSACKKEGKDGESSVQAPASSVESVVSSEEASSVEETSSVEESSSVEDSSEDPTPAVCAHDWVATENAVAAGCETEGLDEAKCSKCGEVKSEVIPMTGHDWDEENAVDWIEATCTVEGARKAPCKNGCDGYKVVPTGYAAHNWVEVAEVPATCHATGWTAYKQCSSCEAYEAGYKGEEIAMLEHVWEVAEEVPATCTEDGLTESKVCTLCGDNEGGEVIPALGHVGGEATCLDKPVCDVCGEEYGEALGHNVVLVEQKFADCLTHGYTTYHYACNRAGCDYIDEYLTPDSWSVIAPKHIYDAADADCTKGAICELCGETVTEAKPHHLVKIAGVAADCCNTGYTDYKACSDCDYVEGYAEIAALGHDWSYTKIGKIPTCDEEGWMYVGACKVCGEEAGEVVLEKLPHTPKAAATCTEDSICKDCGALVEAALGHTEVIVYAQDETCTEFGWESYVYCSVCNKVGEEVNASYPYVEIPAAGHDFEFVDEVPAECEVTGWKAHYECDVCGQWAKANYNKTTDEYSVGKECATEDSSLAIKALVHEWDEETYKKAQAPSCKDEKDGWTMGGECTLCGLVVESEEIEWEHTVTKTATCSKGVKCDVCKADIEEAHDVNLAYHAADYELDDEDLLTKVEAVSATCQYTGNIEYYECVCGQLYVWDAEATFVYEVDDDEVEVTGKYVKVTLADVTTKKVAHRELTIAGKDATCTEAGYTESVICNLCGVTLKKAETIKATGHSSADEGCCADEIFCDVCGDKYNNPKVGNAHVYEEGECIICGDCETHKYNPINHDTVNGWWIYECEVCHKTTVNP